MTSWNLRGNFIHSSNCKRLPTNLMVVDCRLRTEISSSLCHLLGIENNNSTSHFVDTTEKEVEDLGQMEVFIHKKLQCLPDFEEYSSEFIDAIRGLSGEKTRKKMKIGRAVMNSEA